MGNPDNPSRPENRAEKKSLIDIEFYVQKKFFGLRPDQIAQLPDGTALRAAYPYFQPQHAIIIDPGTRAWAARKTVMPGLYGFVEGDKIPEGIEIDPKGIVTITREMIMVPEDDADAVFE